MSATQPATILGLDPGERRIGVALAVQGAVRGAGPGAVPGGGMALPLTVLDRTGDWATALAALVAEHNVAGIIVGLPVSLAGSEGAAAGRAREFAAEVSERFGLPVHLVDERLSTVSAGRALGDAGTRGKRRRQVVDRSAAAIILQVWLDAQARTLGSEEGTETAS